jgi:serine acetyltransferase
MNVTLYARLLERLRRLASGLRVWHARASGTKLGAGCRIAPGCDLTLGFMPNRRGTIVLANDCALAAGVILRPYGGSISIAPQVYVGPGTTIYGHGGVSIGDCCLIGMHCRILSSNHAVPPFGTDIRSQPDTLLPTRIGRDVWLGAGCIIGAGAVVTKDLPPGAIAHGVPAVIKGRRAGSPAT